MMPAREVWIWI